MAKKTIGSPKPQGMCPPSGCTRQDEKGNWRVISNRTGKDWPASYKSKEAAERALEAYHVSKRS